MRTRTHAVVPTPTSVADTARSRPVPTTRSGGLTIASTVSSRDTDSHPATAPFVPAQAATRPGHQLSGFAVRPPVPGGVQAKLTISQPDDKYEQEADRVADAVMRMPDTSAAGISVGDDERPENQSVQAKSIGEMITPLERQINTKCETCEDGAKVEAAEAQGDIQRKTDDKQNQAPQENSSSQTEVLQTKRAPARTPSVSADLEGAIDHQQGRGHPLPVTTRAFFEPRFGHDFSQVRIHADADAASANHSLHAQAFTRGRDIYFARGRYQPQSASGRQLLAHELTHVAQQGGAQRVTPRGVPAALLTPMVPRVARRSEDPGNSIQRRAELEPITTDVERPTEISDQLQSDLQDDPDRRRAVMKRIDALPPDKQTLVLEILQERLPASLRSQLTMPEMQTAPGARVTADPGTSETTLTRPAEPTKVPPSAEAKPGEPERGKAALPVPETAAIPSVTELGVTADDRVTAAATLKEAIESVRGAEPETTQEEGEGEDKDKGEGGEEGAPAETEAAAPAVTGAAGAAQAAGAALEGQLAEVARLRTTPLRFQVTPTGMPGDPMDAVRHGRAEFLARAFIGNIAERVAGVISSTGQVIPRVLATLTGAKGTIVASVETETKILRAGMEAARKRVRSQGWQTRKHIEAKLAAATGAVDTAAGGAKSRAEKAHKQAKDEVDKQAKKQQESVDGQYAVAKMQTRLVGMRAGGKVFERGGRRYDMLRAQRNGESSVLDGPIHDNRLEAEADTAINVSNEYANSFMKTGVEQADKQDDSKPEVMGKINEVAGQANTGLQDQIRQINDGIGGFGSDARARASKTAGQLRSAAGTNTSQAIAGLAQEEETKVSGLGDYASTQKEALDQTVATGITALTGGVTQVVGGLVTSMDEFVASAAAMPAPDSEELAPVLDGIVVQTDAATGDMTQQLAGAGEASDAGVATALGAATQMLSTQAMQAGEQAAATAQNFAEGAGALRWSASDGFAKLEKGDKNTADEMGKNAEAGFQQAEKGARESFGNLLKAVTDNFAAGREQLFNTLWSKENQDKLDADMKEYGKKAADQVQPRWKKIAKWVVTIVVIIAVIAITVLSAGSLGPVGVVLLGATLGALAGAATTIAHNLIDGKKWSEGVAKAMIVGAIGGAFGGAGGLIFKGVGSVALKIGLEAGVDVLGGIAGEVVGSLAVGEGINWGNVVVGALIGAGVGAGLGIAGALKGGFRPKLFAGAPKPSIRPRIETPPPPRGRIGNALERAKVLAPRAPPTVKPNVGLPEGSGGRPTVEGPGARPGVEAPPSKVAVPETKVTAPEAGGPRAAKPEPSTTPRATHADAPEVEPGVVAKTTGADGHEVKVLKDGRVVTCTTCGEVRVKYADELADNPALKKDLDSIEAIADPNVKASRTADLQKKLEAMRAEPALPEPGQALTGPAADRPSKPVSEVGTPPKSVSSYMKEIGADTEPPQLLNAADFSKVKLKFGQDALYIPRDANGTVLKVGKTSATAAKNRFSVYRRGGKLEGRTVQLEVHPLKPSAKKAEYYEKALRSKMEAEGHALPWDNTRGRLKRSGFGTPGEGVRTPPITKGEMTDLLTHHEGILREVGKELGVHRRTAGMWAKALGLLPKAFKKGI